MRRIRGETFDAYTYPGVLLFEDRNNAELIIQQREQPARTFAPTSRVPTGFQPAIPGGLIVLSPVQALALLDVLKGEAAQLLGYVFTEAGAIADFRYRKAG